MTNRQETLSEQHPFDHPGDGIEEYAALHTQNATRLDLETAWHVAQEAELPARQVYEDAKEKLRHEPTEEQVAAGLGLIAMIEEEANTAGNAAADKYLERQEKATEAWKPVDAQLAELDHEKQGVVRVEAVPHNPDATMDVASRLYERVKRSSKPFRETHFEEASKSSNGDIRTVAELSYQTSDPHTIVVEHWSGSTGELLQTTVIKAEGQPIKKKHSGQPTLTREAKRFINPSGDDLARNRPGRNRAFVLEAETETSLNEPPHIDETTPKFRDNLKRLGMSETEAQKYRPRQTTAGEVKDAMKRDRQQDKEDIADALRDLGEPIRYLAKKLIGKNPQLSPLDQTYTAQRERQRKLQAEHAVSGADRLLQDITDQYTTLMSVKEKALIFDAQDEGVLAIQAEPENVEADLVQARELYEHVKRKPEPIATKWHRGSGKDSTLEITEFWYETAEPGILIAERWNSQTGSFLETLAVKTDDPADGTIDNKKRLMSTGQVHSVLDWTEHALSADYFKHVYENEPESAVWPYWQSDTDQKFWNSMERLGVDPEVAKRYRVHRKRKIA